MILGRVSVDDAEYSLTVWLSTRHMDRQTARESRGVRALGCFTEEDGDGTDVHVDEVFCFCQEMEVTE